MDVKTHYIKDHLPAELAVKGISMKTLVKRRKKRELKLAHKSQLELDILKEDEKRNLDLSKKVISIAEKLRFSFPYMQTLVKEGAIDSKLGNLGVQPIQLLKAADLTHKVYMIDGLLKDQRTQLDFINEHAIMTLAKEKEL